MQEVTILRNLKVLEKKLSPPFVIAGSFLILIVMGTFLLKLPLATTTAISWTDALFVATSATTVTGLSVFDPGTTLTIFGQLVLLVLIQCGGIGLMTFAVAILILLRKKIGLQNRIYLKESYNQLSLGGIVALVKAILQFVLTIQGTAIILLGVYWIPSYGFFQAFYLSIFHVVSSFNNAGFSLFPNNMIDFALDPFVLFLLSSLFIIGGLGFTVVLDIYQKNSIRRWSLHTKLMIAGTLILNFTATLCILALEYGNPDSLGGLGIRDKLVAAYFTAAAPRTAGFNVFDYALLEEPTLLFTMVLMFIGAGSASTASGIKLTTFIIVILATLAFLRGAREPEIFGRSIRMEIIIRSLAITTISILTIITFLFLLMITETLHFLPLAFEVVSAFGTVGLSMGVTTQLSDLGEVLLCIVMFIGRIGPLTLFFILMRPKKENYRYPYDSVFTG